VEPRFVHFDHVHSCALVERVSARPLFGENVMLNLLELEPGALLPDHSHEQVEVAA
jgi:quercetin dioxygenase-like cupin family protein